MPDYNLNYVGSSGYGVLPGGRYGLLSTPPKPPTGPSRQDYAVWDLTTGKTVSVLTGKPFSGVDPRTGKNFNNGVESAPSAASAASMPSFGDRYQAREVIKSPAVATATEQLMEQFRKTADSALSDFGATLNQFKTDLTAGRALSREAQNLTPTVEALSAAQRGYDTSLTGADEAYRRALEDAAARERGVVEQANATLPAYDEALNRIIANQNDLAMRNFSRYKMGTGTPRSMGGSDTAILANAALQASLPLEQAKIQRRYDILSGMALPTEERIAGRAIGYGGSFLPSIAGSRYGSQTTLATTIQGLRERVANMSYTDAVNYLRASGIQAELQTAILSGQAGTLGQLAGLEEASRYRGLEDVAGVPLSQPVYYNMGLPNYPQFPTRYPTTGTYGVQTPRLASNGPVTVSPTTATQAAPGGLGGMSWEDLYYAYGLTPEDYASLGGVQQIPNYPNVPYAYAGPAGTVQTMGLVPEYAAGGVG